MTTAKATCEILSTSLDQTYALGHAIGTGIEEPLVITLTGDLASGKTALVQGLARGLEVPREYYITSPSYTLVNEYPGRIPLCHADLYRLGNHADIADTGLEEMLGQPIILAIEWPARLEGHQFENHLAIQIHILAKETRRFEMTAYGLPAVNLLKQIKK
ncbi:MAG: tRNA (adenosine(37)-N6)-threonylcarbamoyltransferase complex ATPase subunit type 1 TsaE [Desulfobacterales bacterium]|nr:tRNA (adenosine(37)-N6)-threonylcarbamoyltransferase complex ATPase subunit type 1 TsaE [Desulfobacterales bacterium]